MSDTVHASPHNINWWKHSSESACLVLDMCRPDKSFGTGFIGEIKDEYFLLSSLHCFLADEKDVDLLLEDPIKLEAKIRTGAVNPPLPEFIRKSKYQFYYMQPDTLEGKQFVAENVGERYDVVSMCKAPHMSCALLL